MVGKKKNFDHYHLRRFRDVYRIINNLIVINDNEESEDYFKEIYPAELELNKENTKENVPTFFHLSNGSQRKIVFY